MSIATAPRQRRARLKTDRIAADQPPPFSVRRFTVDEYHQLIDAGFFAEKDCYELLDGWIVPKMTRKPPHDVCIELIQQLFVGLLPAGWRTRIQLAIALSTSEPEPDAAIVRGTPRDHLKRHPEPGEIGLVIEVADSTVARDQYKASLYARGRIVRYWLINLVDRVIEDHSQPTGEGEDAHYKSIKTVHAGDHLALKLGGKTLEIAVDNLLP